MKPMFFKNVAIEAVECVLPSNVITSADIESQLTDTLARMGIKPGILEGLTGIPGKKLRPPLDLIADGRDVVLRAAASQKTEGLVTGLVLVQDPLEVALEITLGHQRLRKVH